MMIGVNTDGAANMMGKQNGLVSLISHVNPKVLFHWCKAHRLNLVIERMLDCCSPLQNTIGILQELKTFSLVLNDTLCLWKSRVLKGTRKH